MVVIGSTSVAELSIQAPDEWERGGRSGGRSPGVDKGSRSPFFSASDYIGLI